MSIRPKQIACKKLEHRGERLEGAASESNDCVQVGARALYRGVAAAAALPGRGEFRTALSTLDCGARVASAAAFDPCETAGRYELDLRVAYDRTVLATLIRTAAMGGGSFLPLDGGPEGGRAAAGCNAVVAGDVPARVMDNGSIDPADWYLRTVSGVSLPVAERRGADGRPVALGREWATLLRRGEEALSCSVTVDFKNGRRRATAEDRLSEISFALLRDLFRDPEASAER